MGEMVLQPVKATAAHSNKTKVCSLFCMANDEEVKVKCPASIVHLCLPRSKLKPRRGGISVARAARTMIQPLTAKPRDSANLLCGLRPATAPA
jgi:hypothetical protein